MELDTPVASTATLKERSTRRSQVGVIASVGLALPLWLLYRLHGLALGGTKRHFPSYSQLLSLLPGRLADRLRYGFYRLTLSSVGRQTRICFGTTFSEPDTRIGHRVYLGFGCHIGRCVIGDDSIIATGVHVLSGLRQHRFDHVDKTIWEQPGEKITVTIGRDCWIGNRAVIASDVGDKCVVGAAAVVIEPIPDRSIAVGHPAKIINTR
jgi:virginiamycin A acetyltransferase